MISLSCSRDHGEVLLVVNRYIGVAGGYLGIDDGHLGRFTSRTLGDFFPEYCNVEVETWPQEGTSREIFITVTKELPVVDQAKVLRGVLKRFPVTELAPNREAVGKELIALIERIEGVDLIGSGDLKQTSEAVRAALQDAQTLMDKEGPVRAVDRVHTALHGYLKAACRDKGIEVAELATIGALLKVLRASHIKLLNLGERSDEITIILNSFGTIAGV